MSLGEKPLPVAAVPIGKGAFCPPMTAAVSIAIPWWGAGGGELQSEVSAEGIAEGVCEIEGSPLGPIELDERRVDLFREGLHLGFHDWRLNHGEFDDVELAEAAAWLSGSSRSPGRTAAMRRESPRPGRFRRNAAAAGPEKGDEPRSFGRLPLPFPLPSSPRSLWPM